MSVNTWWAGPDICSLICGSDYTVCKSMHPMSQLSTKFTDIPSLSKEKKITKVSMLKSQWQRGSSSRCDQLICGWALPYKVKIPFEDINSISLTEPSELGGYAKKSPPPPSHILAGIWEKSSHSKDLGLIVAPPPHPDFQTFLAPCNGSQCAAA